MLVFRLLTVVASVHRAPGRALTWFAPSNEGVPSTNPRNSPQSDEAPPGGVFRKALWRLGPALLTPCRLRSGGAPSSRIGTALLPATDARERHKAAIGETRGAPGRDPDRVPARPGRKSVQRRVSKASISRAPVPGCSFVVR